MAAVVWLVAGLVLVAAEMLVGELTFALLGVSALLTAGVSFLTGMSVLVDAVIFAVVAVGLLVLVRPPLLRRFGNPPPVPTNIAALAGKSAVVLETVSEHAGRVKLDGEVWTARPLDPAEEFAVGTTVSVMKIDGATAVVWKGP